MTNFCSRPDCESQVVARGLCKRHYRRAKYNGDGELPPLKRKSPGSLVRDDLGRRFCSGCETWLDLNKFTNGSCRDGRHAHCRDCQNTRNREVYYTQWKRHGLTKEQYDIRLAEQNNCCAGCGDSTSELMIDHDHACCDSKFKSCGQCFRGFLCRLCNSSLGFVKDDPVVLRRLADYLEMDGAN